MVWQRRSVNIRNRARHGCQPRKSLEAWSITAAPDCEERTESTVHERHGQTLKRARRNLIRKHRTHFLLLTTMWASADPSIFYCFCDEEEKKIDSNRGAAAASVQQRWIEKPIKERVFF